MQGQGEVVQGLRRRAVVGHPGGRLRLDQEPKLIEVAQQRLGLALPAQRLLPAGAGGQGDVPDRPEAGGMPGLLLQPGVQVTGVAAEEQRGLVRHPGRGDQPGRVPRRPGGQLVLLEQDHVRPAQVGQVIGDAAAGHPAADRR